LNSKNLLTQLSQLESSLSNFSFEELTSEEATRLQKTFQKFKTQLEGKVWGETPGNARVTEDRFPAVSAAMFEDLKALTTACNQMRTPLNGIIGLADMLDGGRLNEEQKYQVSSIRQAGEHLMNMVVEVTEFSRLLAGFENFEQVGFNFHNLIEDVEYLCRTLIVDKRQELKVSLDQAIPRRLKGDPSKLSQVLLHLLGISVKSEFDGNISFDVQFQHKEDERVFLEFVISNQGDISGIGLQSTSPHGIAFKNNFLTGLGLPIVNQIVQKLGGEMFVQDAPGLSATYAFRLPFAVAGDNEPPKYKGKAPKMLKGLKVLVIDTNPLNQQQIARHCKSWGCIPYITDNLLDVERMLDESIDLVLVDLPGDGKDEMGLIKKIRKNIHPRINNLAFIGFTGNETGKAEDSLKKAGLDDIIVKPYRAEELQLKMMQYGRQKRERNIRQSVLNTSGDGQQGVKPPDLDQVFQECMGRMETLEELVMLFKQKSLEFIGSVKLHLDRSDYKGIEYACQKVSSILKLFGTDNLLTLVEQIHKSCGTSPDARHLKFLHHCFIEEYPQVEEAVENALKALKRKQ
jgi:DNA-binding response OmpR family regulator